MIRSGVIYIIENTVTGRVYVGSAHNLRRRMARHRYELRKGIHHSKRLQASWDAHGESAFRFKVVETVADAIFLEARERFWIRRLQSHKKEHGYNVSMNPWSRLGLTNSPEHNAKIGAANRGKVRDEEIRLAQSVARKGAKTRPCPPEVRAKISAAQKGKLRGPLSDEHKAKIGAASKGRKYPDRKLSDEHKAAISAGLKGKKRAPFSEEHRAALSAAAKRQHKAKQVAAGEADR